MPVECEVDGSFFVFPDGWELEKLDEWAEQKRKTQPPLHSKGCDLVAMKDGVLWLVEAKDYTYAGREFLGTWPRKSGSRSFTHWLSCTRSPAGVKGNGRGSA